MALVYAGWDFARIGTCTVALTDTSGGPYTVSWATGTYAHVDLQSVMGSGSYDDFATAGKTAFDAAGNTYTWTWDASTRKYTVAVNAGNFAMAFTGAAGTRLKALLGFTGDKSGAGTYTSDVACYYAVPLARDGLTAWSRPYERSGFVKQAVSVNGTGYSVAPLTIAEDCRFTLPFMPLANTFADDAAAADPWTIEHMIQHARGHEPIATVVTAKSPVIKLAPEYAAFTEQVRTQSFAQAADYHGLWHVRLSGQYLGAL